VTLAALINATRKVGRDLVSSVIGQIGLGDAGLGIARLLLSSGVRRIIGTDINPQALERLEEMGGRRATLDEIMTDADIVIATTGRKGLISPQRIRPGQIILALSNPDPEIEPLIALDHGAAFAADGKGINNVLGFPGLFKGALEAGATRFTEAMLIAASREIARQAGPEDLVPDPLDTNLHAAVAAAVRAAAVESVAGAL